MKVGDKYVVNLEGYAVAEAVIEEIEDGHATLLIPATRVVMGVSSSLTDLPQREPEVDRVLLDDLERQEPVQEEPRQPQATPVNVNDTVGEGLKNAELDSSILD